MKQEKHSKMMDKAISGLIQAYLETANDDSRIIIACCIVRDDDFWTHNEGNMNWLEKRAALALMKELNDGSIQVDSDKDY